MATESAELLPTKEVPDVVVQEKPTTWRRTIVAVGAGLCFSGAALVTYRHTVASTGMSLLKSADTDDNSVMCYNGKLVPTLYVIGCQKCGTTSLWEDSVDHVYGLTTGDYKEHHYWSEGDTRWTDGSLAGMVEAYPDCDDFDEPNAPSTDTLIGADFCPQMGYEDVPANMYNAYTEAMGEDVNDELRFVSILRDPVNRTISYFYHALDEGWLDVEGCSDCCGSWWVDSSCSCEEYGYDNKYCCTEKLTFAERMATCNVTFDHWVDTQLARADACLTDGKQMWPDCGDSGIFGSLYVYQLQNFLQYYQPSQMSVIPFNLYTAHADSAIEAVADAVGAEYMEYEFTAEDVNTAGNHGRSYNSMLPSTAHKLETFFAPYNQLLYDYLKEQDIQIAGDNKDSFLHTPVASDAELSSLL